MSQPGATPVSPAAGQSVRSKLDTKATPRRISSCPICRQSGRNCTTAWEGNAEAAVWSPVSVLGGLRSDFIASLFCGGWALKYRALRSREKMGDLSDGGCDVAHSTFIFFRRDPQGIRWLTWPQREFAVLFVPGPLERAVALATGAALTAPAESSL
jgi:hypothetical protein